MHTGFFIKSISNFDLLIDFADQNNLDLVGVWIQENNRSFDNNLIKESVDDLMSQIELAIIFNEEQEAFSLASSALKKGVTVFLSRFSDLRLEGLLSLKEYAFEIGSSIGFGYSGINLIPKEVIHGPFLIQINRELNNNTQDQLFNRYLIYDLASVVRLRSCGARKIRVFGAPAQMREIRVLNFRIEFNDNSVVSYTSSRLGEVDNFRIQYFDGESTFEKQQVFENGLLTIHSKFDDLLLDRTFTNSIQMFINEIKSKSLQSFGIDKALETYNYLKTIEDKLLQTV